MPRSIHRREFLGASAAAGAALVSVHTGRSPGASSSPNDKLAHAAIGVGGMQGFYDFDQFTKSPNIQVVAICDVDSRHFQKALEKFPDARLYQDAREMLDREADRIDSVNITIPDHAHAPIASKALSMGKHLYCQKPMTHTIWEARQVARAVKRAGVVTRLGTQIHSHAAYRTAVAVIRQGAIGRVKEVHSWIGATTKEWWGPSGPNRPDQGSTVPPELNWDTWLGPAEECPYADDTYHPIKWRNWQNFGSSTLGDFGCHILDPVFTALELAAPIRVSGHSAPFNDDSWPLWSVVEYVFRGTDKTAGKDSEFHITWYDGEKRPPENIANLPEGDRLPDGGSVFVGTEGQMVLEHVGMPKLYPANQFRDYELPQVQHGDHYVDWIDACRRGDRTVSGDLIYGALLTETVHLGNIAVRYPDQPLEWDSHNLRFTNLSAADRWLTKEYREGFELT